MRVEDVNHLMRTENGMQGWMCEVTLSDKNKVEKLRERLAI